MQRSLTQSKRMISNLIKTVTGQFQTIVVALAIGLSVGVAGTFYFTSKLDKAAQTEAFVEVR